jgi:hypothetical protein
MLLWLMLLLSLLLLARWSNTTTGGPHILFFLPNPLGTHAFKRQKEKYFLL